MAGFRSVWAGVGRKRAGMKQLQADLPARLPGTLEETPHLQPLHCTAAGRKPEGCSSQHHPSSAKPEEAKEQRRAVMFYCQCGPIKAFHGEFRGEFHGEHFTLTVSTDIRVLLCVSEVQGCRWSRHCFSLVGAHPIWLQRHLLRSCCLYATTFHHLRNTERHLLAVAALRS